MIPLKDDNPTREPAYVSWAMIAACVLVFLWQFSLSPDAAQAVIYALGVIPARLLGGAELPQQLQILPAYATVFSSMFLHGGWLHLIGNMLYLWIFADNVEDRLGHGRFLAFYLICGVAAAAAQALPEPSSQIPMVGASGAISGVLGAYLLMFPHAQVVVLVPLGFVFPVIRLPALLVLGLWFGMQLLESLGQSGGGGVAFRAHVGGFLAGLALAPLMARRGERGGSRG